MFAKCRALRFVAVIILCLINSSFQLAVSANELRSDLQCFPIGSTINNRSMCFMVSAITP